MSVSAFYETSPVELHFALLEARRAEENALKMQELMHESTTKTIYEAARLISYHTWNSSGRLKQMLKSPKEIMTFAWDVNRSKVQQQQTPEQIKSLLMAIAIQQNKKK